MLSFCEHFGVNPADVKRVPLVWIVRWRHLSTVRAQMAARESVERTTLAKASPEIVREYNALMGAAWKIKNGTDQD